MILKITAMNDRVENVISIREKSLESLLSTWNDDTNSASELKVLARDLEREYCTLYRKYHEMIEAFNLTELERESLEFKDNWHV